MNLEQPLFGYSLASTGRPTSTHVTGANRLGVDASNIPFDGSATAGALNLSGEGNGVQYAVRFNLVAGAAAQIDLATGVASITGDVPIIVVSGTISPDATGEYPPVGFNDGKRLFAKDDGSFIAWSSGTMRWTLQSTPGAERWYSTSDVATPDMASGWTAEAGATGVPTVASGGSANTISDGDGKDFEGKTLPTLTAICGLLFRADEGDGTIGHPDFDWPVTKLSVISAADPLGSDFWLETVTITAGDNGINLTVDVVGAP